MVGVRDVCETAIPGACGEEATVPLPTAGPVGGGLRDAEEGLLRPAADPGPSGPADMLPTEETAGGCVVVMTTVTGPASCWAAQPVLDITMTANDMAAALASWLRRPAPRRDAEVPADQGPAD